MVMFGNALAVNELNLGMRLFKPSAVFIPPHIPNLVLWLLGDTGTFQDAALTIPAVLNGDPIGGWQDQSGSGNHVTELVAGKRPLLQLGIVNGLPVVRFDGIDDRLRNLTLGVTQPWSIFLVFTVQNWVANRFIIDGANNQARIIQTGIIGQVSYNCGNTISVNGFTTGTFWLYTGMVNGAATDLYRNNLAPGSGNVGAQDMPRISIAARGTAPGTAFSEIDVAEIVLYDALLSDANRLLVWNYLNTRYALW